MSGRVEGNRRWRGEGGGREEKQYCRAIRGGGL